MSLSLLLPIGLAALAALLLPLLLHLDRQAEPRPISFAALRWLSAQLRPRRRLRVREWLLLVLRLLLVAAVALLLAWPQLTGVGAGTPRVFVAAGISPAQARAAPPAMGEADWHWLLPGFPVLDAGNPPPPGRLATSVSISSLLREIDASLPPKTAVTVVVPEQLAGLDAERPRVARPMQWKVLPGVAVADTVPVASVAPTLVVRHADDRVAPLRFLRAASAAWVLPASSSTGTSVPETRDAIQSAPLATPLPADARWLVWLAPGELPANVLRWVEAGGILLADAQLVPPAGFAAIPAWRDADGAVLASTSAHGAGRIVQLTRPLRPDVLPALLEPEFPQQLRALFTGEPAAPDRAFAAALRPQPGGPAFPETPRPLAPWLIWLAAGLFVLERWLASAARRGATA